ncbi:acetyltransferase-like isoleucine patch superfamily enzyme [Filimonas zeae]|uniref:Acyltransferase n=1 Tax=Filimonas zeae TaxID=1737353 RepID=A0A917IZ90_9BACT|nr:acyltransferase [Filimonas zeae]MDR6340488.1 acetyltransferase-like isoleucine patch superfamily enzyme [Filimonas zeae]GGH72976.1 hypothetical protein GCM10011379_33990 [Filimonas zeae]
MSTLLLLLKAPGRWLQYIRNYVAIKRGRIVYTQFPEIHGLLIVNNNGYCQLGYGVTFRSSPYSNYVGLSKKCSLFIGPGARLVIGNHAGLSGTTIYCANAITIGHHVNFGGNVCIWDTDFHPLGFEDRRAHVESSINTVPVTIGDDVFVGANTLILKGVTIGHRSVIGAGSVVTKSIPDDEVWAGNPARFIKKMVLMHKLAAV